MARNPTIAMRETLHELFSPSHLRSLAWRTGTLIRQRKANISIFFWTLLLGFGDGRALQGHLADIRDG